MISTGARLRSVERRVNADRIRADRIRARRHEALSCDDPTREDLELLVNEASQPFGWLTPAGKRLTELGWKRIGLAWVKM